jgi:hypothetical protein
VKRGLLNGTTTYQQLFSAGAGAPTRDVFFFDTDVDDTLAFYSVGGFSSAVLLFRTNAVFRDVSAWYHIVLAVDTTQATAANRMKLYVNGVQQTFSTANYPAQNSDGQINNTINHAIGRDEAQYNQYLDGYLADIHFIDGQALTPSDFGEYDDNNVWQPKEFAGTYGTNGFHLDFSDNSSNAALGTDTSGNGNTWTVNNLSVAAGAGNDSLVDTPEQRSDQTDSGSGGEVVGNYCTWNPLNKGNDVTLSNGNLQAASPSASKDGVFGTIGVTSGKWYWEVTLTSSDSNTNAAIGVALGSVSPDAGSPSTAGVYFYASYNGSKWLSTSDSSYGASYAAGDTIGVALDATSGTLIFYKNGSTQGTATSSLSSGTYFPYVGDNANNSAQTVVANFGQRAFHTAAPAGYKCLCTANLSDPTIADGSTAMDTKLYTGNGGTQTISGLEFSPDLVWIKTRSANGYAHILQDTVRGAGKSLASQNTNLEVGNAGDFIGSFNSDGFSVNTTYLSGTAPETNGNGDTFVGWAWDGGSSTVTNTDGSISSQVRANPSAGFSIATFTTPSSGTFSFGHGLSDAPKLVIVKARNQSYGWTVYAEPIGNAKYLVLNTTAAEATGAIWNNTTPTSTVVHGNSSNFGTSTNYVAYCFAPVEGYSAFGSYEGNASDDGPFVYTGFRPAFVLTKWADGVDQWQIHDTARSPENVANEILVPNTSSAEATYAFSEIDILSNGFKVRNSNQNVNAASTYIYAAFAENPFKTSRAR